jgi:hypothetical protein
MMPQSTFMVLAPIDPRRELDLRSLLASMNDGPGRTNANNSVVPFSRFDTLHVARFVIVDDKTVGDVAAYGLEPVAYPLYLAFVGDVDGDGDAFLRAAAHEATDGLRAIFSCCEDFKPGTDLLRWMKAHSVRSAATYVNWRGRTVRRTREDAALFDVLQHFIQTSKPDVCAMPPQQAHAALRTHVRSEVAAGRLTLSPEPATPLAWRIRDVAHLVGVPVLALAASPVLLPAALLMLLRLRLAEKTDAELCARVDDAYSNALADLEDHDVTNQFTAMGSIKPGLVRRWSVSAAFFAIDYAARHIFTRGGLARVRTIHFARWVFLDGKKRAVFMSNYDGSLESYMDDFINKVGFGLNVAFSGGIGYPTTKWLVGDGCSDERKFKEYLRRHQVPTQVWYKAYPGLTAIDLERNGRIRDGLEQQSLTEQGAREWVALL